MDRTVPLLNPSCSRWLLLAALVLGGCGDSPSSGPVVANPAPGQSAVQDTESQPNIVQVASGSADHSTLVAAVQAAGLVDALANAGPFTVFAPVNAAFGKLPAGTVETLLKPENQAQLKTVLYHHVTTSSLDTTMLRDGQILSMVDGTPATIGRRNGALYIGECKVLGSVKASNGMIHVVDSVLLPPNP
jgi:uncharacterized surface protein with fasciclin (FAS1) repeats